MVMELVAAILVVLIMIPVVRHPRRHPVDRGWFMNMFEAMFLFIRDEVARPAIGGHGADRFLPYLWTVFFFVLFNNLLGMIPGVRLGHGQHQRDRRAGGADAGHGRSWRASGRLGFVGYWVGIVPHLDVPALLKPFLWGADVLHRGRRPPDPAHRAGRAALRQHVRGPRGAGRDPRIHPDGRRAVVFWLVMPASIVGVVCLSLLELFVAFLQAYIFTFLSALFIGAAVHPH